MKYLRHKFRSLMCRNNFKGYLKTVSGYPLTLTDCLTSRLVSLSLSGNAQGVGEETETGYKIPVNIRGINLFNVNKLMPRSGGYVQNNAIYVTGYPYNTVIYPEDFLEMTGLKTGDIITCSADYEQVYPSTTGATYVNFSRKNSNYPLMTIIENRGTLKTTVIPEEFNINNYSPLYIYAGGGTPEAGEVRGIYRNFKVYKGEYTTETMPPYEPYHSPQKIDIIVPHALTSNEKVSINFLKRTALLQNGGEAEDISGMQDWTYIPITHGGKTENIYTDTKVNPSNMTVEYYTTKPEEG